MGLLHRSGRRFPDRGRELLAMSVAEWRYLAAAERDALVDATTQLVATKTWEAARGFVLTDEMCTLIAGQAALVVLELGVDQYRDVKSVIVHPRTMISGGPRPGPVPGLLDDTPLELLGEAHGRRGPVLLAWNAVAVDLRHPARGKNVVIHEFVHKLDMLDGLVDGTPPLADEAARRRWADVSTREYEALRAGEADPLLSDYAATDPGEFFAVAAEVFFTRPVELATLKPALYAEYRDYFGQDPAARR